MCFGDIVYKYFIIFFIRKDVIGDDDKVFKKYLFEVLEKFKIFIERCD